jgi:phosphatidylserine decarboxylase
MFTTRTLLEGKWPILVSLALSLATIIWCPVRWAPVLPLALLAFAVSFFRDPERKAPSAEKLVIAPADGRIVEIRKVDEPHFLKGEAMLVAIFLSVFDVHVQRAPVSGEIKFVRYNKGRFLDARNAQASQANESRLIAIESPDGFRVTVRQIAGLIARRIVGWADSGTKVNVGERIGMIRFGSRVELLLPMGTEIVAKVGDYAKGGETIIARRG